MKTSSFLFAALLLLTACEGNNARYCDEQQPCEGGRFCDIDGAYGDTGPNACIASPGENACNRLVACPDSRPFCSDESKGVCGECQNNSDCDSATPTCDPEILICRACQSSRDCDSELCLAEAGTCVDSSEVIYIAKDGSDTDCGGFDSPCATFITAKQHLSSERQYIVFRPGQYADTLRIDTPMKLFGAGEVILSPNLGVATIGVDITATARLSNFTFRPRLANDQDIGISSSAADVVLDNLTIENMSGGTAALRLTGVGSSTTLSNSTIANNETSMGLQVKDGVHILSGLQVTGNKYGIEASTQANQILTIENSSISENTASGIEMFKGTLHVSGSRFLDNGSIGLFVQKVRITRTIVGNNGQMGIDAKKSFHITNSFIYGNGGGSFPNGGVHLKGGGGVVEVFEFNTLVGNTIQTGASAVRCDNEITHINNNIFFGTIQTNEELVSPLCSPEYSLFSASDQLLTGTGNQKIDPIFVNPDAEDYHLQDNSPGVDEADPSSSETADFDGDERPQAARSDIGADEVVP